MSWLYWVLGIPGPLPYLPEDTHPTLWEAQNGYAVQHKQHYNVNNLFFIQPLQLLSYE